MQYTARLCTYVTNLACEHPTKCNSVANKRKLQHNVLQIGCEACD